MQEVQLKHCFHSLYSSVFVMAVNSCVLIGFLGAMFIRLASKNENSRNVNFERKDRFKEGTNSVDEEKKAFWWKWGQA